MRIHSIDLLKIIFTFLVVFGHMDIYYPGAAVAVDFFFVFSGFFLAKKFYSKSHLQTDNGYDQFRYTVDRIKVLYPQYIFSLLVLFCYIFGKELVRFVTGSPLAGTAGDLIARAYELVPNVLAVQDLGFFAKGMNAAAWYVSVMLIVGYFIYGLLCKDEKFYSNIVLPIVFILIGTYMAPGRDPFHTVGPFYNAILKGVMSMTEGLLVYKFFCSSWCEKFRSQKLFFNLVGICATIALFLCERYNNQHIIMFALVIIWTYTPESWINRVVKGKIFKRAGDWAYAVYLNHAFVIMVLEDLFAKLGVDMVRVQFAWIAAAAAAVYSVLTLILLDRIKLALKK